MAVKYVNDFSFPSDFGFHKNGSASVPGKARGGKVSTPQRYARGGVAKAPVPMGAKKSWNKDDAVSPGSPKRTPPSQNAKNTPALAKKPFAAKGENTPPATKQTGTVQRMAGWSDFKKGGQVDHRQASTKQTYSGGGHAKGCTCSMCSGGPVKKASGGRIANLGKYAHGGKVYKDGSTQKPGGDSKYEKAAGTPKRKTGSTGEVSSGKATGKNTMKAQGEKRMAGGGLTRSPSKRKEAAIHAKEKKSHAGAGALAAMLGGAGAPPGGGMAPPAGQGMAPPGMAPGAPPSGPGMGAGAPPMAAAPTMSHGGPVARHVFVHHISHKA